MPTTLLHNLQTTEKFTYKYNTCEILVELRQVFFAFCAVQGIYGRSIIHWFFRVGGKLLRRGPAIASRKEGIKIRVALKLCDVGTTPLAKNELKLCRVVMTPLARIA